MRSLSLASVGLLLLFGACGSESGDSGGGEITSQEDVQQFFQAVAPELIGLFTELADQQSGFASALSSKQGGDSTVPCPDGGSLEVNTNTGQATLVDCAARGVVINATLALFVQALSPGTYQASFNGNLTVSGTFTGTIQIVQALIQWSDPPSDETTYWEVTVLLDGEPVTVTSGDSGNNGGEGTTFRFGGSCVPGQQGDFSCTTSCLDICRPEEVAQIATCAEDSICECKCVNYNL